MRWTRRRMGALALLGWGLLGCRTACGEAPPPAAPEASVAEIVLGATDEPKTLDPAFIATTSARQVAALLHRGLVRFDPDGGVQPDLARSLPQPTVTSSAVRVEWALEPRFWEDGTPVTAEDFRWAWRLERKTSVDMVNTLLARDVVDIETPAPDRFVAVWRAPRPGLVAPGVHTLLPSHAYPEPDPPKPFEGRGKAPLSNGPYRLETWRPGVEIVLGPNPYWPGVGPRIPRVRVRFYANENALFLALLRGEVDAVGEAAGLGGAKAGLVEAELSDTHVVHRTDGGLWVHLVLDLDHPVVKAPSFRRVVAAELDRKALAQVFGAGAATPAHGMFPRNHPAHVEGPAPTCSAADRTAVRALAATRPSLDLHIASESRRSADLATLIAEQMEPLGFDVRIRAIPFAVLNARLETGRWSGMALYGWRIRPDWDANSILHSEGRQNFAGLSDPQTDVWLERAQRTLDRSTWAHLLERVEARYRELWPSIPLLHGQVHSVRPVWLEGWQPTGTTTPVTWNAEVWTGAPEASDPGREVGSSVTSAKR